jgi:group I intron endonuclease
MMEGPIKNIKLNKMLTSLSPSYLAPVIIYLNAQTDKSNILTDNKGKTGIYLWIHIESNKKYVGSAIDLSRRLRYYYSSSNLKREDNYISRALICHGYSAFSLTILEYIDISNLSSDEAKTLILFREQYYLDSLLPEYNILKIAGSRLGSKHTEESIAKMNGPEAKSGENHPMLGKTPSAETIAKLSLAKLGENNPRGMQGKTHTPESLAKMSAANGTTVYAYSSNDSTLINTFPSSYKAAEHYKCGKSTISRYIKSGKLFKGEYILSINLK